MKIPKTFPDMKMPDLHQPFYSSSEIQKSLADSIQMKEERDTELAGRNDAKHVFQHLLVRVKEFEDALPEDEEIGLQLANFGRAAELHIRTISYKNPNLVEFTGVDLDQNNVSLIQHISQLNFLLVALKPTEEKPYRIGFHQ